MTAPLPVSLRRLLPLGMVVVLSALGSTLASRPPDHLMPSLAWRTPSAVCPLGCGDAGVDLLSLLSTACLRAIALAVLVAFVAGLVGTWLGAAVTLRRGRLERGLLRLCDLLQAFPTFLVALAVLAGVNHPERWHLAFVFLLTAWAPFARLAIAETRVLRKAPFVEAGRALGGSSVWVLRKHIVPNLAGTIAVQWGASAASVCMGEAALAFLGLGPRDGVSLGGLVDQGVYAMFRAPHVLALGAVALLVVSSSLMMAGRALDSSSP